MLRKLKKMRKKGKKEEKKRKREKGRPAAREKGGERESSQEKRSTAIVSHHGQPRSTIAIAVVGNVVICQNRPFLLLLNITLKTFFLSDFK